MLILHKDRKIVNWQPFMNNVYRAIAAWGKMSLSGV